MSSGKPTAATGQFPWPGARTVAEVDTWTAAKVRRELNGLRLIERANRLRPILRGDGSAVAHIMTGTVCGTCGGIPDPRCSYWNCPKKQAA